MKVILNELIKDKELIKTFIESLLENYDYTPYGIGKALAFLYEIGNKE